MGSEIYVQIFLSELDAEGLCLVVGVAADDNTLAVRTLEDDGLQTVFYRIEGKERAARLNEVGEVLVGVILWGIAVTIFDNWTIYSLTIGLRSRIVQL